MTSERPNVTRDGRYSLNDTAKLLSVSTMTIRRHTKAGLLECGRWPHNGRAFYTGREILKYWRQSASVNINNDNDNADNYMRFVEAYFNNAKFRLSYLLHLELTAKRKMPNLDTLINEVIKVVRDRTPKPTQEP